MPLLIPGLRIIYWLLWALGYSTSVATAIGFIALAGVAAEFGVVMLIYLRQAWEARLAAGAPPTEALLRGGYVGPAPVPLEEYVALVEKQSVHGHVITRARVLETFHDFVIDEELRDRLKAWPEISESTFSMEDQKAMDEIAQTVKAMAADGIKLEVCDFAVKANGMDPASILPEIKHVPNSWISLIGYQARGYSIVPVY